MDVNRRDLSGLWPLSEARHAIMQRLCDASIAIRSLDPFR